MLNEGYAKYSIRFKAYKNEFRRNMLRIKKIEQRA